MDATPPSVAPALPVPRTVVAAAVPEIAATATDNVGLATARLQLDGATVASELEEGRMVHRPEAPLCPGTHRLYAVATDLTGAVDTTRWSFRVPGTLRGACARLACRRAGADVSRRAKDVSRAPRGLTRARRSGSRSARRKWSRLLKSDARALRTARATRTRTCRAARRR